MTINIGVPEKTTKLKPRVLVLGVGGGGCNALNLMIASKLKGVEFVACNTDAQSLEHCNAEQKIQLGVSQTQGLGAGSDPAIGKAAAEESYNDICEYIDGAHMAFITSGMGGGTGTGAVSVLARACKEKGILTVAVVTKPFNFEGTQRMENAEKGIRELKEHVDTLIVIPNQNLFIVSDEKTPYSEAITMADEVLHSGVRGITDLMMQPGLINLDFADVKTVMGEMGRAVIGNGEASGERRAIEAAEGAVQNPLLDHTSMKGAKGLLLNVAGGSDMTLVEVSEAVERVREEIDNEGKFIYGSTIIKELDGIMRVSLVATGIENNVISLKEKNKKRSKDEIFERMNSKIKDEDDNLERKKQSKLPEQTDLEEFTTTEPVIEVERDNDFAQTNDQIINKISDNHIKPANKVMDFIKKYSPLKIFKSMKEDVEVNEDMPIKNEEKKEDLDLSENIKMDLIDNTNVDETVKKDEETKVEETKVETEHKEDAVVKKEEVKKEEVKEEPKVVEKSM